MHATDVQDSAEDAWKRHQHDHYSNRKRLGDGSASYCSGSLGTSCGADEEYVHCGFVDQNPWPRRIGYWGADFERIKAFTEGSLLLGMNKLSCSVF